MRRTRLAFAVTLLAAPAALLPVLPAICQETPPADRTELRPPVAGSRGMLAVLLDRDGSGRETEVLSIQPDGVSPRVVLRTPGRLREPAFSPGGDRLAFRLETAGAGQVRVLDLATGEARLLGEGIQPHWSPDGARVLLTRRDPRRLQNPYRIFALPAARATAPSPGQPLGEGRVARWAPDGNGLAVAATGFVGNGYRWQVRLGPESGTPTRTVVLDRETTAVHSLDWSPDGRALLLSLERQGRGELWVLPADGAQPQRVSVPELKADFGCWSPDGTEILFRGSESGQPDRLLRVSADGSGPRVIWQPESATVRILGVAWSHPPARVAAVPPPPASSSPAAPAPLPAPIPAPAPALTQPPDAPATPLRPAEPVRVLAAQRFTVPRERSPVTVPLQVPAAGDWVISVPVLPSASYRGQRQGVGISAELEDGSLYRGNLLVSRGPWVTLQGRPPGGRVRLVDGRQLSPGEFSFRKGFTLILAREGADLVLSLNGAEQLRRPLLRAAVRRLSLTLENFDPADTAIPLGNVYYRALASRQLTGGFAGFHPRFVEPCVLDRLPQ